MKLPKIVIAVAVLHVGVIAMIFVQPGCQSRQYAYQPEEGKSGLAGPQDPSSGAVLPQAANDETIDTQRGDSFADAPVTEVPVRDQKRDRMPPARPTLEVPVDTLVSSDTDFPAPVSALNVEPIVTGPAREPRIYIVQSGDSPWKIANTYGVSVGALLSANGMTESAVIHPGDELRIPDDSGNVQSLAGKSSPQYVQGAVGRLPDNVGDLKVYYVVPGDSLSAIAKKLSTTVSELKRVNGLRSDRIYAGQELRLPQGSKSHGVPQGVAIPTQAVRRSGTDLIHVVKGGETLSGIARRYGVSVPDLMEYNGIKDAKRIKIGLELIVKRGTRGPVPADPGAVKVDGSASSSKPAYKFDDVDSIPVVPVQSDSNDQ